MIRVLCGVTRISNGAPASIIIGKPQPLALRSLPLLAITWNRLRPSSFHGASASRNLYHSAPGGGKPEISGVSPSAIQTPCQAEESCADTERKTPALSTTTDETSAKRAILSRRLMAGAPELYRRPSRLRRAARPPCRCAAVRP